MTDDEAIQEWAFPNPATALGSPAYYAVRFTPPKQHDRNAMLLAWLDTIEQIADRPHDPGVARIKLDWWRKEISTLEQGAPRHPLLQGLAAHGIDAQARADMAAIVDAAEQTIVQPQTTDEAAFEQACIDSLGRLFRLIARLDGASGTGVEHCDRAGGYCAAVSRVQRLAERPHRLPPGFAPDRLRQLEHGERRTLFDDLLQRFANADRVPDLTGLAARMYAIHAAIHRKMQRQGYPVDRLVDRPPIAHLWTAWRCR